MKTFTKTIAILAISSAFAANATISVNDTDTTSFDVGGTVAALCKVTSTASNASSLNLAYGAGTQEAARVNVWCNNGSNATTTYASTNNGTLRSGSGDTIGYTLTVGGQNNIDLTSTSYSTATHSAGTGTNGATAETVVSISPTISGLENAGSYSDTITVTVAPN